MSFNLELEYGWFLDGILEYADSNVEEFLEHFGVKGMRWGTRKAYDRVDNLTGLGPDKIQKVTKSGDVITLEKSPPNGFDKTMAKLSQKYVDAYNHGASLTILDSSGKKVGVASVEKRSDDELYLNWLGVDKSARGKGYASAAMKAAEEYGSQSGFKKMTLEVPGESPDARHIYEKLGFKVVKEAAEADKDDIWGGLTEMEYVFDKAKHTDLRGVRMSVTQDEMDSDLDDFLEHFGVKGMRWGRRTSDSDSGGKAPSRRQQNKALNKQTARDEAAEANRIASKQKDPIDAARIRTYTGANRQRVKDAKEQYRADKVAIGTRAAKTTLRNVKNEVASDYKKSQEYKNGWEAAEHILNNALGNDAYGFGRQAQIIRDTNDTIAKTYANEAKKK